jgi:sulfopropanediol 3-dehydrogenase
MAIFLKCGISAKETDNTDLRHTIEGIISDVRARGDLAVRELSAKFDNWSPPSFRLSADEIASIISQVSRQTLDDIMFAQAQVRNFARHQRAASQRLFRDVLQREA